MEKEFVPYLLALELWEIGFDEPCFGYYDHQIKELDTISSEVCERLCKHNTHIKAPTFSQAFRWFREKYNLVFNFISYNIVKPREYHWSITWNDEAKAIGIVKTYEEAELACLKKLIQIVKEKL